jgi:hypothetical protein
MLYISDEVGRHGRADRPQPDLRAVAALALDRLDHRVLAEEAPRPEVAEALVVLQHLDLPLDDEVHLRPDLALQRENVLGWPKRCQLAHVYSTIPVGIQR